MAISVCNMLCLTLDRLCKAINTNNSISNPTVESKMIWMRVLIVSSLLALLQAHKHCTQLVKWENLLQALNSMVNLNCLMLKHLINYSIEQIRHELCVCSTEQWDI